MSIAKRGIFEILLEYRGPKIQAHRCEASFNAVDPERNKCSASREGVKSVRCSVGAGAGAAHGIYYNMLVTYVHVRPV